MNNQINVNQDQILEQNPTQQSTNVHTAVPIGLNTFLLPSSQLH